MHDYYKKYWNTRVVDKFVLFRARKLSSLIKSNSTVIDLGGGSGESGFFLRKKKVDYITTDISKKAINRAKKRGIKAEFVDLSKPIKIKAKFDYVIFNEVLEHLFDPLFAVKEAKKLLNRKGKLIVSLPNEHCVSTKLYKRKTEMWNYPHIRDFWNLKMIKTFLRTGGFKSERIIKIANVPLLHYVFPLSAISKVFNKIPFFVSNWIIIAKLEDK